MIDHISVDIRCAQCQSKNSLSLHRVKPSKSLFVICVIALLSMVYALFVFGGADTTFIVITVIGVFGYWSGRKLIRLTCSACQKRTELSRSDTEKLHKFFKAADPLQQAEQLNQLNKLNLQCLKMERAIEKTWDCKSCSEENPGHFNVCWCCDTTNDELESDLSDEDFTSVAQPLVTNGILMNEIRFNTNEDSVEKETSLNRK